MPAFHDITAAVIGAGFIGPVHVEGLRRAGVRVKGIAGISADEATRAAADTRSAPRISERGRAARGSRGQERARRVAEPAAPRSRARRPQSRQARRLRKATGDDVRADERARRGGQGARRRRLPPSTTTSGSIRSRCTRARSSRTAASAPVLHVHGSYVQDWLLYPTDFNWRVLRSEGGELRAVGDIGTHWLDLVDVHHRSARSKPSWPISGPCTRPGCKPPSGSVETFAGKQAQQPVEREPVAIDTEDYGAVLLQLRGRRARRADGVAGDGRAEELPALRDGRRGRRRSPGTASRPTRSGSANAARPTASCCATRPCSTARRHVRQLSRRPQRGLPRHLQAALSRGVYGRLNGARFQHAAVRDVRGRPPRSACSARRSPAATRSSAG